MMKWFLFLFFYACQSPEIIEEMNRKQITVITPPRILEAPRQAEERDWNDWSRIVSTKPSKSDQKVLYPSMVITNQELVGSALGLDQKFPQDLARLDRELGVIDRSKVEKLPNFIQELEEINILYQERKFERLTVKLNHLLEFFPESPKLLRMKGTVYLKLGFYEASLNAFMRAYDLQADKRLKAQIDSLKDRLAGQERTQNRKEE